jgi:hypothetical protein
MWVRFHLWSRLFGGCLLAALVTGCVSLDKAFWQKRMNSGRGKLTIGGTFQNGGVKPALVLTRSEISKAVVSAETNGAVRVSYGPGLQAHAAVLAREIDQALGQLEAPLGMPMPWRLHIHLLRLPGERRVLKFSMSVPGGEHIMPWLLPITNVPPRAGLSPTNSPEALWADLKDLPIALFLMAHEAYEMRLIDPADFLVMPDVAGGLSFLHWTVKYHTRWFREGYANYAGYQASQCLRRQLTHAGLRPDRLTFVDAELQPLTKLAKVREALFDWNQNSRARLGADNYEAALGLFLLLERRQGPEAIAAVIRALPQVKLPDGKALLKLVREKTALDPRQLVREFAFPDFGLELAANARKQPEVRRVQPQSWAATAKLSPGDIILEVNGCPVEGLTQYELQLLRVIERRQDLVLTFSRNGQKHVTNPEGIASLSPGLASPPILRSSAAAKAEKERDDTCTSFYPPLSVKGPRTPTPSEVNGMVGPPSHERRCCVNTATNRPTW